MFSTVKLHLPASVEGEPNVRKEMSLFVNVRAACGWIRVARLRVECQLGRYNEQEDEDGGVGWCPLRSPSPLHPLSAYRRFFVSARLALDAFPGRIT